MTSKLFGYAGKTLRVDLSVGKIEKAVTDAEMAQKFIGGMGYSAKTLYDEVGTDVQPFGPENIIVFAPGALTGTHAPASARVEVTTKSPLTGIIGTGNTGGSWGVALKRAGYDAIVVRGEAESPVYLAISDEQVELRDARDLWGRNTFDVTDTLRKNMGGLDKRTVSVMAIGIAGENRVRYACPVNDYYHVAGRAHVGGVMGAKKLKAIAVRGTGRVQIAKPIEFNDAVRESRNRILSNPAHVEFSKTGSLAATESYYGWGCLPVKNYQTGVSSTWVETRGKAAALKYITRPQGACFDCPMPCFNLAEVNEGKYAGVKISNGTFSSAIQSWGGNCAIDNLPAIYKCKEMCHLLGVDYGSAAGTIAFAMELYQRGLLSAKDADGLNLEWGNEETVLSLLNKIANREGFGNLLAEGSYRAAQILGRGAERYSMSIKGLEMMWADPRASTKGWAFGYLTSPRGGDNMKGTHFKADIDDEQWPPDKFDIFPEVKRAIYGESLQPNPFSWERKAPMTKWFEDLTSLVNALGVCVFPVTTILALGPYHLSRLFSTATGWEVSPQEIMKIGERIFTVLKAFEVREGLTRKEDTWPERFFTEPLPEGPTKGAVLSREEIDRLLDQYYELRGWDKKTGLPSKEKLTELGLGDIAEELSKMGKLPR